MSKNNATERELLLRISDKIDDLNVKLHQLEIDRVVSDAQMNATLILQEANLREHMKRTEINEENIDLLNKEIKPVLQGLGFLKTVTKIVSFVAGAVAAYFKLKA